jgi:hypothetical protein
MYTYEIFNLFNKMPESFTRDIYQVRGNGLIRYPTHHMFQTVNHMRYTGAGLYCFRFESASSQHRITFFTNPDAYKQWAKEEDKILNRNQTDIDPIHEGLCHLETDDFFYTSTHPKKDCWRCLRISLDGSGFDDEVLLWLFHDEKTFWDWVYELEIWHINFVLVCFSPNRRSPRSRRPLELLTYEKLGTAVSMPKFPY